MQENCLLNITMDRVIHFGIQSQSFFFASVGIRQKIVIRKFWKNAAKIFKKIDLATTGKNLKKSKILQFILIDLHMDLGITRVKLSRLDVIKVMNAEIRLKYLT